MNLFLCSLRLVLATDTFIMLVIVFFAHWFTLNQMFKFSVSFATEVEKNRPLHGCFNRGVRYTKVSKRATGHLSPPTNNAHDLKSLLFI